MMTEQALEAVGFTRRHFGCAKGQIVMADDSDVPLPDFEEYMA